MNVQDFDLIVLDEEVFGFPYFLFLDRDYTVLFLEYIRQ
jgi:hypothetical protein